MATNLKRFMISVTPSMETDLDLLKKEQFYNNSQAEMLRYVIGLGLASIKEKTEVKGEKHDVI